MSGTPVIYTFGIVIIIMLFFGYLVGGWFFNMLLVSLAMVLLYGIYNLAKGSKGSGLLNFFGILYMFVGSLSLILYFIGNPNLELYIENIPMLSMPTFIIIMGVLLKFVQHRAVLTLTLLVHGILTVYLLTIIEATLQLFAIGMLGLLVDAFLLIYVNIMKGMIREIGSLR